jgi:anaerobic selenocysteine-containing dehydrogenase
MPQRTLRPPQTDTCAHQVRGACPHDCPDTCALLTTVEDGVAIKVQGNPAHRHTGGVLCTKVSRYTERTYHPERVLYPIAHRPQGLGQFERVSWDEALADIAARLGCGRRSATRRPSCPTATPAPWAWCRAKAWRRASFTAWAHRCWTAPSAPPPAAKA